MPDKVTFSWANYTKPTPRNLEYIASSIRRIIAVIAGTTIIMESSRWVPFGILLAGAVMDELKNFFAHVAEGTQEIVSVSYPEEIADKVSVNVETKDKPTT